MKLNYKIYLVSMLCYVFFTKATAQEHRVEGRVTDSTQNPIPGVNLQLQHFTRGTTTNFDGEFSLNAGIEDTLIISYLGFKTQRVPIGSRTFLEIALTPEANALKDVVINAGYYTTTERERTGSISKVTAKEIENQPLVSPLQALQGRVAGLEVSPGGNIPGAAPTIRIRGQNSLRKEGNYPLYIIDGVPVNSTPVETNSNLKFAGIDPLSTLNLSNIESIEVLKDADATAIYGSKGANGVILITTKKGVSGKTTVQARIYTGISQVPNRLDLLHTQKYLQIRRKAFENDGVEPTEQNAYDLLLWDQNRYTDWQEKFLGGNAAVTNVNLSVSGGSRTTHYRLNGAYQKQGTVYPGNSHYHKATAGFSMDHHSKDEKLSLALNLNYGLDKNKIVGNSGLASSVVTLAPNAPPIFNEDGSLHWEEWNETGINNPLSGYYNTSNVEAGNLISNLVLTYQLYKGLNFKTNLGFTDFNSEEIFKVPKKSYNPLYWDFLEAESTHLRTKRNSWIIEPQLNYTTKVGELNIEALIGGTFQENKSSKMELTGRGYVSESLIGDLAAAKSLTNGVHQTTTYRYNAIFGRLGFNWNHKYLLNLTGRRDGSSRFGPSNRFANFGAVGSAWIFTKERFVKEHFSFLSFGKLRASYGTTGNDQIGDYEYLDAYEATPGPGGLYPTALANPDYSWETNKKLETALQLGFLKDRINLGISWYRNRSSNQLVGLSLPGITGFGSVQANLPATVENKGWEVELSSLNFKKEKFSWRTSLNISFPKNELVNYPNLAQSSYANTYRVGEPLNIALLYQYEGLDPKTGFYSVSDVNEDGRLDYEDEIVVKNKNRQYYGGINNSFTYKNFSLQFLWQFVKQEGRLSLMNAGPFGGQRAIVEQALGEHSKFQEISNSSAARKAYRNALNSSFGYTDASFIRLKTLSLSYTIPSAPLKTVGVETCKLFMNAQNLITLTDYEGLDPEVASGTGADYANLRTITLGAQLNF